MKGKKIKNEVLIIILVLILAGVLIVVIGGVTSKTPDLEMNQGTMKMYFSKDGVPQLQQGDNVYLGVMDEQLSFDTLWQVLDPNKTNTGEVGMFLMSKNLIAPAGEQGILFNDVADSQG